MASVFSAFVGGWCLRAGLEAAVDGRVGWAAVLLLLGGLNLAFAVANARGRS